jgi:hypothetical protein
VLATLATTCLISARAEAVCTAPQPTPSPAEVTLWPGGRIPFVWDANVTQANRDALQTVMDAWEAVTGSRVVFVPKTISDTDYVRIKWGGCSGGYPHGKRGGEQLLNVSAIDTLTCPSAHEFGHTIGLGHEHERIDRDRFITVQTSATECTNSDVWKLHSFTETSASPFGEYALSSVMHYIAGTTAQCTAGPPEVTNDCAMIRNSGPPYYFGVNFWPTAEDGEKVRELYATDFGSWKRFRSLGIDLGATSPLTPKLKPSSSNVTVKAGSSPAAVWKSADLLYVFVRGSDDAMWYRVYNKTTNSWDSSWTSLGGGITSDPAVAVLNGGPYVCARGTDNAIWCNWELSPRSFGGWWSAGGTCDSAPAVASWGPDRLDLFCRVGNNLWQRIYDHTWAASWGNMGGPGVTLIKNPTASSRGPGLINLYVNSSDNHIRDRAFSSGAWSGWGDRGCCSNGNFSPATGGRNGRQDLVMTGTDGSLWYKTWTSGSGWDGFKVVGGRMQSSPAVAVRPSSPARMDILKVGTDGTLWHRWLDNY